MGAPAAPARRLSAPRIPPVASADFDPIVQQILAPQRRPEEFGGGQQPVFNVFRTLAAYPALMKRMSPWGNHLLFKSSGRFQTAAKGEKFLVLQDAASPDVARVHVLTGWQRELPQ